MTAFNPMRAISLGALVALLPLGVEVLADETTQVIRGGKIGFVLTDVRWANYQTPDGKAECPGGLNEGPREQFAALFPNDGTRRTLTETQLAREGAVWVPQASDMREPLPFKEATGKIAPGLDLDGKVGPNDFVGPDGQQGIDNELWRVLGCIAGHRGPSGDQYHFINEYNHKQPNNRFLIEVSEIESLVNDDHVVLTTYRGLDSLLADATGSKYIPGGTQRSDLRWGKDFVQRFEGKIVDGVLSTSASDSYVPMSMGFDHVGAQYFRAMRFRLKLDEKRADGFMGGYVDVNNFYRHSIQGASTHHLSYGQQSAISVGRALSRRADAYPDPKTGANTAISSALKVQFTQAYIVHSEPEQVVSELQPARIKDLSSR